MVELPLNPLTHTRANATVFAAHDVTIDLIQTDAVWRGGVKTAEFFSPSLQV